jgi:hypothetical protein
VHARVARACDRIARVRAEDGVLGDQRPVEVDGERRDSLREGLG